ncbi:DUF5677 domain-containing protein (plasmid) [Burkholderia vietnamiensis]|uniref:Uncharacterized protein n=1 Tax=Burkholderia vietnamiensis (strain G4 / LMG 22486) TaxID=269482 RepID=A4JU23_BURVG|nr:hypothetical protein Bcep1808_6889 [Burkholderia vietnamiensis G4]MCB4350066.1 DUF5677 domain-containing protein [Burkholderia vietnamiensis]
MAAKDSVETRGFLSIEIEELRGAVRQQYAPQFAECDDLSDLAVRQLREATFADGSPGKLFAAAYWMRCIRACQGAILLAERGLIPDSLAQTRTAAEALFHAVALVVDPGVVERLIAEDQRQKRKQVQGMTREQTVNETLSESDRAALLALLEAEQKQGEFSAFDAAHIAGLDYLYQTMYRGLSLSAAHSTLTALDHEFVRRPTGEVELDFGPSTDNLEFALGMIAACLKIGVERMIPVMSDSSDPRPQYSP